MKSNSSSRSAATHRWRARSRRAALVFGYAVGLDLTRRDLQAAAKAKGLPWDTGKGFDISAPVGELVPRRAHRATSPRAASRSRSTATQRQASTLDQLIWDVPEILARAVEALRAEGRRPGLHGHARGRRPAAARRRLHGPPRRRAGPSRPHRSRRCANLAMPSLSAGEDAHGHALGVQGFHRTRQRRRPRGRRRDRRGVRQDRHRAGRRHDHADHRA